MSDAKNPLDVLLDLMVFGPIGFATEASRKMVSRRIGAVRSNPRVPIASTCSCPRRLMSATRPGSRPRSTCRSRASCIRASRMWEKPLVVDRGLGDGSAVVSGTLVST